MAKQAVNIIGITFSLLLVHSCKSDYQKLVETELATGKIFSELPFDLEFGMTKKEYFEECWTLNKEGVIGAGPGNQYAMHMLMPEGITDSLYTVRMLFYGMFDEETIMHGMDMKMEFVAWSPWNKEFQSPQLVSALENHFAAIYPGNDFVSVNVNKEVNARVKVDGNRRITMYPLSDQKVAVKIVDMNNQDKIVK